MPNRNPIPSGYFIYKFISDRSWPTKIKGFLCIFLLLALLSASLPLSFPCVREYVVRSEIGTGTSPNGIFVRSNGTDHSDLNASVFPESGINGTLFSFNHSVPNDSGIISVELKIENRSTVKMEDASSMGERTVFYRNITLETLPPGSYNYFFIINSTHGEFTFDDPAFFVEIVSPIASFMVTPLAGHEKTVFVFSVIYRNPSGEGPRSVNAAIDNTTHFEMRPTTSKNNFNEGVNYSINSLAMDLGPGRHTYYPVIWLDDDSAFIPSGNGYLIFEIAGDKKKKKSEEEWYEDKCCFIPLIFLLMLLIFTIINNIRMKARLKKRQGAQPSEMAGMKRAGEKQCSNCNTLVSSKDTFCPRCGETFDEPEETVCAECGNRLSEGDEFCARCGLSFDRKIEEQVEKEREIWKKEIEELCGDNVSDDEFICSMCGASVKGRENRCPHCNTEFE